MYSSGRDIVRLQNIKQEILNDFSDEESAIYQAFCPKCLKRELLERIKQDPTIPEKFLRMSPAQRRAAYDKHSTPEQWVYAATAAMLILERGILLIQLIESHQTILNSHYQDIPGIAHHFLDDLYHKLSDIKI